MSISSGLGNILKIFGGAEPTDLEKMDLMKEAALMTLARATASDTNIKAVEVDTVRDILERVTGEDVSSADVRVAANSKLYESAPLEKYLANVGKKIDVQDRIFHAFPLMTGDVVGHQPERSHTQRVRRSVSHDS